MTLRSVTKLLPRLLFAAAAFVILAVAILRWPQFKLDDFDQSFYITIAYDLDRYGTFSNGVFDRIDSARERPPSGMFFVPGYPLLVLAAMKLDHRFAAAVACNIEAQHGHRDGSTCEPYATPVRIIHAFLLAIGVLAISYAGEIIFASPIVFWVTAILSTASLAAEAEIFSYVMTEAMAFSVYSVLALSLVLAWKRNKTRYLALSGILLGALCLTRPSYVVLLPIVIGLDLLALRRRSGFSLRTAAARASVFAAAFALVVGGWVVRNAISVGKVGLSEEYGAAVLIERFAYNDMTAWEYFVAFPYCTPGIGDLAFDLVYGTDSMHRFVFHTQGSFFHAGRDRRDSLVREHGRLDPLIGGIVRDEMRSNWWRHLLVSIPLAWCGMWVGWLWALLTIPLFVYACVRALHEGRPLLLFYAAPAVVMLGLHGLVANQYTRYNLILIGPFCVGAAWIISAFLMRRRSQALASAP
jgi:hypothetical protein